MSLDPPYKKELHRQLHEYYEKNGMDKPLTLYSSTFQDTIPAYGIQKPAEEKRVVPAGVNFVSGQRVSGTLRTRYLDHLRDCYEEERIDLSELSARQDAMMLANTKEELDFLLYDLPKLPVEVAIIKPEEEKGTPYSASLAFSFSAITMLILTLIAGFSHVRSGNTGEQAIFGLSLIWMVTFGIMALVTKKR